MCPRCGALRYAKASQKTALCFKCGYQIPVDPNEIRVLFRTEKSEKAIEAMQKYKIKRSLSRLNKGS